MIGETTHGFPEQSTDMFEVLFGEEIARKRVVAKPTGEALAPILRAGILDRVISDPVPGSENGQGLVVGEPERFDQWGECFLVSRLPKLVDELRDLVRGRRLAAERRLYQRFEFASYVLNDSDAFVLGHLEVAVMHRDVL